MCMRYLGLLLALLIPLCATSSWREGFKDENTLYLVGEGHAKAELPHVQRDAMAREAAVMDAMSHWAKLCGDADASEFRVENQKLRSYECHDGNCRARVVIEKKRLRQSCKS